MGYEVCPVCRELYLSGNEHECVPTHKNQEITSEHPQVIASDPPEYTLLVPFVVCASAGGVFDDESFVAGIRYGRWSELLKLRPAQHADYEPSTLIPQLDLLAMHHGYTMITQALEDNPEWVWVTMRNG